MFYFSVAFYFITTDKITILHVRLDFKSALCISKQVAKYRFIYFNLLLIEATEGLFIWRRASPLTGLAR